MRVTFVLKGHNPEAIATECVERGVAAKLIGVTKTETVLQLESPAAHLEILRHWFCEQPALIPGYGYPDGTLLIYSVHTDESVRVE